MNMKFLKPTKAHLGLFVLVFILIFSLAPCRVTSFFEAGKIEWCSCGALTKIVYLLGGFITDTSYSYFGIVNLAQNIYPILIFEITISYVISSLIVFTCQKLRK
ncbi:MAG: hypothetical protein AYK18_18105 [Theionarchaea archaeon DG-70]|nr:MAG: hypothetical protein AYK18_18105 [Theionarchaea archaeon DG-70]